MWEVKSIRGESIKQKKEKIMFLVSTIPTSVPAPLSSAWLS